MRVRIKMWFKFSVSLLIFNCVRVLNCEQCDYSVNTIQMILNKFNNFKNEMAFDELNPEIRIDKYQHIETADGHSIYMIRTQQNDYAEMKNSSTGTIIRGFFNLPDGVHIEFEIDESGYTFKRGVQIVFRVPDNFSDVENYDHLIPAEDDRKLLDTLKFLQNTLYAFRNKLDKQNLKLVQYTNNPKPNEIFLTTSEYHEVGLPSIRQWVKSPEIITGRIQCGGLVQNYETVNGAITLKGSPYAPPY